MRSRGPFIAVAILLVVASSSRHGTSSSQEPPVPRPPLRLAKAEQAHAWLGAASCASAACHNGPGDAGWRGHEYAIALERDPRTPRQRVKDRHAQAYDVLFDPLALEIERRLQVAVPAPSPHTDTLCLRCHVTPAVTELPAYQVADGVSCEACHGPAERWAPVHFRAEWQQLSVAQRRTHGQYDTRSLVGRIRVCVDCHVGAPGMEVNHDLIAAGHPRLTFEFTGFHTLLHKHWDHAKDTDSRVDARGRADFEARGWILGQLASAQAALQLLAARADEARNHVWPEFAEHDCAACHHFLNKPARPADTFRGRRPGVMPVNPWYVTMLPDALAALAEPANADLLHALESLRTEMERNQPRRHEVATRAQAAATLLDAQLVNADLLTVDPHRVADRLARILAVPATRRTECADILAQRRLAQDALNRCRRDLQVSTDPLLKRATLRVLLQLPPDAP